MKKFLVLALASASFAVSAANHDHQHLSATHLTETNVTAGYTSYDIDGIKLNGLTVGFGKQFDNNVYLRTAYTNVTEDVMGMEFKVEDLSVVVGRQFVIDNASMMFANAGIHSLKASVAGNGSISDEEFSVSAGYKRALSHKFSMLIGATYMDSEVAVDAGLTFSATEKLAITATYQAIEDLTSYTVGVKYYF